MCYNLFLVYFKNIYTLLFLIVVGYYFGYLYHICRPSEILLILLVLKLVFLGKEFCLQIKTVGFFFHYCVVYKCFESGCVDSINTSKPMQNSHCCYEHPCFVLFTNEGVSRVSFLSMMEWLTWYFCSYFSLSDWWFSVLTEIAQQNKITWCESYEL